MNQGWNGKNTSAGSKIDHVIVTSNFPYTDSQNRQIVAADVDAFWDNYYAGYTRVSGTSAAKNCYGYATPHAFWINDLGITVILADEYQGDITKDAVVKKLTGHMIKIYPIWYCLLADHKEYTNVKKTSEKNRDSGVYEMEAVSHPYLGPVSGAYKRK
jgi:hypothetical protein